MAFVLGFGQTEIDYQKDLQEEFRGYVEREFAACPEDYFDSEFTKRISKWAEHQATDSRIQADRYRKAANFPDRYSSYYVNVLGDANHIVFIVRFTHINRRHGLSPDGWASFQTKACFFVDASECREAKPCP